jgi:hypothetical protein
MKPRACWTLKATWQAAASGLLFALAASSEARAAYVGDYFFPSTLATTVPTVADFFNPPSYVRLPSTATTRETDVPVTYSKTVTSDLAVTLTETFRILEQANGIHRGFDNVVLGADYQLYTNTQHQFIVTVGGTVAIGGTGSTDVANSFSTFTPTVIMGKGFGDLPDSVAWLRPLGITAQASVALPTRSPLPSTTFPTLTTAAVEIGNPDILLYSFALEYSLVDTSHYNERGTRYARGFVPLVEFAFTTPLNGPSAGLTTGTVNPGVIWVGRYLQVGLEAIIPINTTSGRDIGVRLQAHLYLPQIFPDSPVSRPIFSK